MNKNNSSRGRQAGKNNAPQSRKRFNSKSKQKAKPSPEKNEDAGIRLNKFISNSGICSRREADTYIEHGSVTVNNNLVTEMGYKVKPGDQVRFDGSLISIEQKRYMLMLQKNEFIL